MQKKQSVLNFVKKRIDFQDEYGCFKKDIPERISTHCIGLLQESGGAEANVYLKVEWKRRKDGGQPKSTWVRMEEVGRHMPKLGLEYYQEHAYLAPSYVKLK